MGGRGAAISGRKGQDGKPNEATEYYVSGEGMWINQYLRGRGDFGELSDSEKQYLKDLDSATNGTIKDDTLYRSVDAGAIFGGITDAQYSDLFRFLRYGADSFGKGAYAEKVIAQNRALIDRAIGRTINEKGFMSTTTSRSVAEEWGDFTGAEKPVVIELKTGGRAKGVNLSAYDRNVPRDEAQHERLLARNQSYTVENIKVQNGQIYVYARLDDKK